MRPVVVDLGCGAGALAASLAVLLPDAEVHGVELDPAAAACARRTGGFTVHEGSWWSGLPDVLRGRVDLAVAYLPHVPTDRLDGIHPDFRNHEPSLAVDGGPDGLDPLRDVLAGLDDWLAPDGTFVTLLARDQVPLGARVLAEEDDDVVVAFPRRTRRLLPLAVREAVHLLRPADRDGDPAGPVARVLVGGDLDDRQAAEVLLGLDERPVGEDGRLVLRDDAADRGRGVQAAVGEDEDSRGSPSRRRPPGRACLVRPTSPRTCRASTRR